MAYSIWSSTRGCIEHKWITITFWRQCSHKRQRAFREQHCHNLEVYLVVRYYWKVPQHENCSYKLTFNPILLHFNSSTYVNMKIAFTKRYSILYNYPPFLFKFIWILNCAKRKFVNDSYSNPLACAMVLVFGVYFSTLTLNVNHGGILLCVSFWMSMPWFS